MTSMVRHMHIPSELFYRSFKITRNFIVIYFQRDKILHLLTY